MTLPKNVRAIDRDQGEARKACLFGDPRNVIHKGPGRTRTARLRQDRHIVQEEAGGVGRDRTQKVIGRGNVVASPRVSEAVTDGAPAHHQDSAACPEEGDLFAEHLDPFMSQGMDTMLDSADGFGVVA